ncbi:hypothetical protein KI387_013417, partial [Taxus chinensis]
SEFIAECFMRLAFISGFTGSAGTAAVTKDKASLWTDGRYFLQAENQLGPDWMLMRAGTVGVPTISEWLTDVLSPGSKIGIDPFLFSSDAAEELKQTLSRKDHKLVYVYDGNLVDEIWKEARPKSPSAPARVHDIKYAGLGVSSKINSLRQNLMGAGATAIVISMLDEVAWLLNLRGNDVRHSPVAYAYLIVELHLTTLFIDQSKIASEVMLHLTNSNVTVKPYGTLILEIERLAEHGAKLWLDTSCTSVAIVNAFHSACRYMPDTYGIRQDTSRIRLYISVTYPDVSAKVLVSQTDLFHEPNCHCLKTQDSSHIKIDKHLRDSGFTQSHSDSNLFVKSNDDDIVILIVYVDDLAITGSGDSTICKVTATPLSLFHDNQGVLNMVKNPIYHACTKHIEIHHYYIRQLVDSGDISFHFCPPLDQPVDVMIKPLGPLLFVKFRDKLGVVSRDAAALAEFWSWLETKVIKEKMTFTEVEAADRLLEFRAKQTGFLDTSFDTISGSGANGAIIHYRAQSETCSIVDDKNLYLLDSGGQYVDGTTDVTRTVHMGEPSSREKECFTRVLQGHITLDQAIFPHNTPGFVLDVLARSSLWKIGLDYRHGTGHGVGASLNVHEGPQSISYRYENMTGLQEGMIVSNEPGYYEDRSFGIRIENLLTVREVETPNRYGGDIYLGFEKLTFVPIQIKLLDLSLMSPAEIEWLNKYHSEVWEK